MELSNKQLILLLLKERGYYCPDITVAGKYLQDLLKGNKAHLLHTDIVHIDPGNVQNKFFSMKKMQEKLAQTTFCNFFPATHLKNSREWYATVFNTYSNGGFEKLIYDMRRKITRLAEQYCKPDGLQAATHSYLSKEEIERLKQIENSKPAKPLKQTKGVYFMKPPTNSKQHAEQSFIQLENYINMKDVYDDEFKVLIEKAFPPGNKTQSVKFKAEEYKTICKGDQCVMIIQGQFYHTILTDPNPNALAVFKYLAMIDTGISGEMDFIEKYTHTIKAKITLEHVEIVLDFKFKKPYLRKPSGANEILESMKKKETEIIKTPNQNLLFRYTQARREFLSKNAEDYNQKVNKHYAMHAKEFKEDPVVQFELTSPHSFLPTAITSFRKNDYNFQCGICSTYSFMNYQYTITSCRHIFCVPCSIRTHDKCALCKKVRGPNIQDGTLEEHYFDVNAPPNKIKQPLHHRIIEKTAEEEKKDVEERAAMMINAQIDARMERERVQIEQMMQAKFAQKEDVIRRAIEHESEQKVIQKENQMQDFYNAQFQRMKERYEQQIAHLQQLGNQPIQFQAEDIQLQHFHIGSPNFSTKVKAYLTLQSGSQESSGARVQEADADMIVEYPGQRVQQPNQQQQPY